MEVEEETAGDYNTCRRQLSIFAKGLLSGGSIHHSLRDLRKGQLSLKIITDNSLNVELDGMELCIDYTMQDFLIIFLGQSEEGIQILTQLLSSQKKQFPVCLISKLEEVFIISPFCFHKPLGLLT